MACSNISVLSMGLSNYLEYKWSKSFQDLYKAQEDFFKSLLCMGVVSLQDSDCELRMLPGN